MNLYLTKRIFIPWAPTVVSPLAVIKDTSEGGIGESELDPERAVVERASNFLAKTFGLTPGAPADGDGLLDGDWLPDRLGLGDPLSSVKRLLTSICEGVPGCGVPPTPPNNTDYKVHFSK